MKIELKANRQGQIYIPKILREQWGNEYVLIPNAQGGYIFPKKAGVQGALKSLEVVQKDLEHRAQLERGEPSPKQPQTVPKGENSP